MDKLLIAFTFVLIAIFASTAAKINRSENKVPTEAEQLVMDADSI